MTRIRILGPEDSRRVAEFEALYSQLRGSEVTIDVERLKTALSSNALDTVGAFNGRQLVGIGSVAIIVLPLKTFGLINDVVVEKDSRGSGIAPMIMRELFALARLHGAAYCELTSNPTTRKEANRLYPRVGMKLRGTNVYRLELED